MVKMADSLFTRQMALLLRLLSQTFLFEATVLPPSGFLEHLVSCWDLLRPINKEAKNGRLPLFAGALHNTVFCHRKTNTALVNLCLEVRIRVGFFRYDRHWLNTITFLNFDFKKISRIH